MTGLLDPVVTVSWVQCSAEQRVVLLVLFRPGVTVDMVWYGMVWCGIV